MTDPPRSLYRLERDVMVERTLPPGLLVRTVSDRDDAALGELMERAYAGTIDEQLGDNSDGAIEVASWRDEPALVETSVVVVDSNDTVLAASLCSGSWDREVWIAYIITEPPWKGQGLGTVAVAESVRRIRGCSNVEILAAVTDGNTPSERLLTSIGFERVVQEQTAQVARAPVQSTAVASISTSSSGKARRATPRSVPGGATPAD